MIWHLIVNVGPTDVYAPELSSSDARLLIPLDHPTSPWYVGNDTERVLAESLHANPHPVIRDLVRLAVSVYAADLRVPRKRTDDRWKRDLMLYLPVSNVSLWSKARPVLLQLLSFLTGDHWEVKFRAAEDAKVPASTASPSHRRCVPFFRRSGFTYRGY